jgi:fluoroacetyl-CoA thioesterase
MHPGPARGARASMTVTVTDDMTARFEHEEVHPVYGTAALVRHMEQVSRQLLKPHLEEGEEGVGVRIEVAHREPVPVGAAVELEATVATVNPHQLVTDVLVRSAGRVVAHGVFEQAVVDLESWRAQF